MGKQRDRGSSSGRLGTAPTALRVSLGAIRLFNPGIGEDAIKEVFRDPPRGDMPPPKLGATTEARLELIEL
jgi:hypothetical protein